jgi:hypothetical protein
MTHAVRYGYASSVTEGIVMVWNIPVVSRPEHPTNILNKYAGNRLLAALPEQPIAQLAPTPSDLAARSGMLRHG